MTTAQEYLQFASDDRREAAQNRRAAARETDPEKQAVLLKIAEEYEARGTRNLQAAHRLNKSPQGAR